ncbi:polysaccharide biosynthesis/export family protein [Sphingomonas floccifaciens]|uniref:Polysaccharide biosynthesis/export family protein n=1 Tax=Sphingomonas floccifaciens TaxID=1844115 RepID=A0ABW4NBJ3_9SPHN
MGSKGIIMGNVPRIKAALVLLGVAAAAPVGAANAQAGAPVTAPAAQPYRVNAGDELNINVWGEERLQRDVRVLPDGSFAFPLAGQINAQGKLLPEIEATLTERLREQYRGQVPKVTVSVRAPNGLAFTVIGRVRSPGTFSPGRYVNVLEALGIAGGPAEFANLDNVVVLRKQGGQVVTMRTRLAPIFKANASASDLSPSNVIALQPGDTVIVP